MAFLTKPASLSQICDLLKPGLEEARVRKSKTAVAASISIDYASDCLFLTVQHRLFSRREIEDGSFKNKFGPFIYQALCIEEKFRQPSHLRVERSQLRWRGAEARKTKAKRR